MALTDKPFAKLLSVGVYNMPGPLLNIVYILAHLSSPFPLPNQH